MGAEVMTLICVVVLPTLLLVDFYTAKRRQRQTRQEQGHLGTQEWKDILVLKDGETIYGVIERGKRQYAFVTKDATPRPNEEER